MAEQGFGCMGFSAFYASAAKSTDDNAVKVFHDAVKAGVSLFNTATFYGALNVDGFGANLRLIRKCMVGIDRSKIQLMVKIGMDTRAPVESTGTRWVLRGDEEGLRADVDYALKELGVEYIDIIVLCRVSPTVPIEESARVMAALVKEGKARHFGLCEASASTIRKAHAVSPVYCIEQEWSMWTRDIEVDIVPTCRELGIKIVAYSPLGCGFLTGSIRGREADCFDENDFRLKALPKFQSENLEKNLQFLDTITSISSKKGCTIGQLALAWLTAQGSDIIPIPGTTSLIHLRENLEARNIKLTAEELIEMNTTLDSSKVAGDRNFMMAMTFHGNADSTVLT